MQVPNNSKLPLDWVQRACSQNPIVRLMADDGQPTENYSTGPVRLSWTDQLFKARKTDQGTDKFGCTILWPGGVDLSPLVAAANAAGYVGFPENMTANGFNWAGLQSPWHDQLEKASKYKGYTPGAYYINVGTQFQPRIVDTKMNDIVDPKRVYPGVWAICAVNAYPYGHVKGRGPTKRGVAFGLQSTVIIADDEILGGGGLDPRKAFKGINVQSNFNPAAQFTGTVLPPSVAPSDPNAELRRLGLI